MRLSKTIAQLAKGRASIAARAPSAAGNGRLSELTGIARNPGSLRGLSYVPHNLRPGAPLVVVLHGCTQSAAGYDRGAGWSQLADEQGFALLYPEQQKANNPYLCFNWFQAGDARRGKGEAASIAAMVEAMATQHELDRARVFVTGLSAGGAMAGVMLACYPEMFAGGALIAGIPFGCAASVAQAFDCMGGRAGGDSEKLAAAVRRASPHKGPWPRVSVWQGSADHTVVPGNAEAIVAQWAAVHGLDPEPGRTETVEGYPRRVWEGEDGEVLIEHYSITGMGHGTPLKPGRGEGRTGEAGAHMLGVGISSSNRIAEFWGIAEAGPQSKSRLAPPPATATPRRESRATTDPAAGVQKVIEDALRSAGLMR
jgi:poly(hydroxyalkanoate) depolymerase family esterase